MAKTTAHTISDVSQLKMLRAILDEIRLLRNELIALLPSDELEDYAHPRRIKHSYLKAIKKYPPSLPNVK